MSSESERGPWCHFCHDELTLSPGTLDALGLDMGARVGVSRVLLSP